MALVTWKTRLCADEPELQAVFICAPTLLCPVLFQAHLGFEVPFDHEISKA